MSQNCSKRCCFVALVLCTIVILHINLDLLHGNVSDFARRFKNKIPSLPSDNTDMLSNLEGSAVHLITNPKESSTELSLYNNTTLTEAMRIISVGLSKATSLMPNSSALSSAVTFQAKFSVQWPQNSLYQDPIFTQLEVNTSLDVSRCKTVAKVGFMKTHKTASSTVQNILLRLAHRLNLNLVLPRTSNHLSQPMAESEMKEPFQPWYVSSLPWHKQLVVQQAYDMTLLHVKWNHESFKHLLGPTAVYVTILRNPVDAFESLFLYAGLDEWYKLNFTEYIKGLTSGKTIQYLGKGPQLNLSQVRVRENLGLNQQMFDLGMSAEDLMNETKVEEKIRRIQKEFHLVMIAERFEESVVLLADILCLPLREVVSLKVNERKPGKRMKLTLDERAILSRFHGPDQKLYNYFNAKLDEKIIRFGISRMRRALDELKIMNDHVRKRCVLQESDKKELSGTRFEPYSGDVVAFKVREDIPECVLIGMSENIFVNLVRGQQFKRWRNPTRAISVTKPSSIFTQKKST